MKQNGTTSRRRFWRLLPGMLVLACGLPLTAAGAVYTTTWKSGGTSGNWAATDAESNLWYRFNDGWDIRREDLATGQWSSSGTKNPNAIVFANGDQATMTVNAQGGAEHQINKIWFSNSTSRTFAPSGGAYLKLMGDGTPKIEAASGSGTGTYTFTVPLLLDIHPGGGHFRLTAGAYLQPNSQADLSATPGRNTQIGSHTYAPDVIGTLTGKIEVDSTFTPYLGIGFGNTVGRDQPVVDALVAMASVAQDQLRATRFVVGERAGAERGPCRQGAGAGQQRAPREGRDRGLCLVHRYLLRRPRYIPRLAKANLLPRARRQEMAPAMANDPAMEPLRFAIVGAGRGRFAAQVARALPAQMQIVAVCDLRAERARSLARECGAAFVTDDFARVLERDEVDPEKKGHK